jgi:hypothetical protein
MPKNLADDLIRRILISLKVPAEGGRRPTPLHRPKGRARLHARMKKPIVSGSAQRI